ncbi:MAG: 2Fe-2S iron-sulfur cluster binding domain-containing protein [Candidatus Thermoplasmatota archaeon]|nr:2Fe-2S iron-sulfur cluster binding domain-containing protein [Candidatus Thermoplasmatota archaeon]
MTDETLSIRFFRGKSEIGKSIIIENLTILDLAEDAGVEIPRNCTSGTCGTCIVKLISGPVPIPDQIPPGLDEYLMNEGGILSCCLYPSTSCEIDITPPI